MLRSIVSRSLPYARGPKKRRDNPEMIAPENVNVNRGCQHSRLRTYNDPNEPARPHPALFRPGASVRQNPSRLPPGQLYGLLRREAGLRAGSPIADLGSGTGVLSKLFLDHGHPVFAVEPNAKMRRAAETRFALDPSFSSVAGRAEATTLPGECVDFVTAGQAFHWFDALRARQEMLRILKRGGCVALIWNQRDLAASAFMRAYEALLEQFGTDYSQEDQQRTVTDESIAEFFGPGGAQKATLANQQVFDAEGLRGRLLSSSYTPTAGDQDYAPMLTALDELFARHQQGGVVHFIYQTVTYHGQLLA